MFQAGGRTDVLDDLLVAGAPFELSWAYLGGALIGAAVALILMRRGFGPHQPLLYAGALIITGVYYLFLEGQADLVLGALLFTAVGVLGTLIVFSSVRSLGSLPKSRFSPLLGALVFYAAAALTGRLAMPWITEAFSGSAVAFAQGALLLLAAALEWPLTSSSYEAVSRPVADGGRRRSKLWAAVLVYSFASSVINYVHPFVADAGPTALAENLSAVLVAVYLAVLARKERSAKFLCKQVAQLLFPILVLSYMLAEHLNGPAAFVMMSLSFFAGVVWLILPSVLAVVTAERAGIPVAYAVMIQYGVWVLGSLAGVMAGTLFARISLTGEPFSSLVTALIFLALVFVTFETGVVDDAKTLWGLEEKRSPRAFYDERSQRVCDRLAVEAKLSERERDMLFMAAQGMTPKEMAEKLTLSVNTIRTHIAGMYRKLEVHSRGELLEKLKQSELD